MSLWQLSAVEVVEKLKTGEVTPLQLIEVVEARLQEVEPRINAIPIVCFERAKAAANRLIVPANPGPGYLYGLPIVVKDSTAVKGVLWTNGSKIFRNRVAEEDDPHVEHLERNGALIIGKSNLPEFGAGANTYNEVFGETRNPWNLTRTCGGSSGGTAAALAAGEVWLGTGGDLGGSLRIPASFCGVVGFRSSVGVVPQRCLKVQALKGISGAMARSVADLALMLDAMAGQHPRDPESLPAPSQPFQAAISDGRRSTLKRIAWSADLEGTSPTDPEVACICERAARWFETRGATVSAACPDLSDAEQIFQVLRAAQFAEDFQAVLGNPDLAALLKPELHWQIREGLAHSQQEARRYLLHLTSWEKQRLSISHSGVLRTEAEVEETQAALKALQRRVEGFFDHFDLLCTPCVMVPPFDVRTRWLQSVGGVEYTNYVQWLLLTFVFSLVDIPVISLPCGVTKSGLPVGLQIVGSSRADAAVLHAAYLYERNHPWKDMVPLSTCKLEDD